jgi:hypothetical protein
MIEQSKALGISTVDDLDTDTWEQKARFKMRRIGVDGPFHLPLEPIDDPILPLLCSGFLSLELKEGVTHEEAKALLDVLDAKVASVTYTGKANPEWQHTPGRREQAGRRP